MKNFKKAGTWLGLVLAAPFFMSGANATTVNDLGKGNGDELCLVGSAGGSSITVGGGNSCGVGGSFSGEDSIVQRVVDDLGFDFFRLDDGLDQVFTFLEDNAGNVTSVRGRARYAGNDNEFGFRTGASGNTAYTQLLAALTDAVVLTGGAEGGFTDLTGLTSGDLWRPTLDVEGNGTTFLSSRQSDNAGNLDHMVTFRSVDLDPAGDGSIQAFRYIIGFEDQGLSGDQDFNDYVVEIELSAVQALPEPGVLALLGLGLVGLGVARRRKSA